MCEPDGFSLHQLMELAGQAVAIGAAKEYPIRGGGIDVLVIVGPGNNGGDGWVAARHLAHFGYSVTVLNAPGEKSRNKFSYLIQQCLDAGVEVLEMSAIPHGYHGDAWAMRAWFNTRKDRFVIDSMLGFSATGEPRGVYKVLIGALAGLGNVRISLSL